MTVYSGFTDQQLAVLLKQGDRLAYTEIYTRYTGVLYGHAYSKLQDREEARDLVQELFTHLWLKHDTIFFNSTLSGYLYTAVRNRVLNTVIHKRVASDYIKSLCGFLNDGEAITDHLVREKELIALIEKEIDLLPAKMKEIFELSRKDNLSHKQIAERLNLSEKTVKNQVNNALKILRVKLGPLFLLLLFIN